MRLVEGGSNLFLVTGLSAVPKRLLLSGMVRLREGFLLFSLYNRFLKIYVNLKIITIQWLRTFASYGSCNGRQQIRVAGMLTR